MKFESFTKYLFVAPAEIRILAESLISLGMQFENGADNEAAIEAKGAELEALLETATLPEEHKEGLFQLAKKGKYIRKSPSTTGSRPDIAIEDFLQILPTGDGALDQIIRSIVQSMGGEEQTITTETAVNQILTLIRSSSLTDNKRKEVVELVDFLQGQ